MRQVHGRRQGCRWISLLRKLGGNFRCCGDNYFPGGGTSVVTFRMSCISAVKSHARGAAGSSGARSTGTASSMMRHALADSGLPTNVLLPPPPTRAGAGEENNCGVGGLAHGKRLRQKVSIRYFIACGVQDLGQSQLRALLGHRGSLSVEVVSGRNLQSSGIGLILCNESDRSVASWNVILAQIIVGIRHLARRRVFNTVYVCIYLTWRSCRFHESVQALVLPH